MKIFNWVQRRLNPNIFKDRRFGRSVKKGECVESEIDSVLESWKDGILTIGTFGYDPLIKPNFAQQNNKDLLQLFPAAAGRRWSKDYDDDDNELLQDMNIINDGNGYFFDGEEEEDININVDFEAGKEEEEEEYDEEEELNPLIFSKLSVGSGCFQYDPSSSNSSGEIVMSSKLPAVLQEAEYDGTNNNKSSKRTTLADLFFAESSSEQQQLDQETNYKLLGDHQSSTHHHHLDIIIDINGEEEEKRKQQLVEAAATSDDILSSFGSSSAAVQSRSLAKKFIYHIAGKGIGGGDHNINPPPRPVKKLHKLMKKILKRKIHPEDLNNNNGEQQVKTHVQAAAAADDLQYYESLYLLHTGADADADAML